VHKTVTQFPDKYDIKLFEITTVLTSVPHNIYKNKQNYAFFI